MRCKDHYLTGNANLPSVELPRFLMIYIQIQGDQDAKGFLLLAKSGSPVVCLAENTYGVRDEHLKLLKRKRIRFKELEPSQIRLPNPALAI